MNSNDEKKKTWKEMSFKERYRHVKSNITVEPVSLKPLIELKISCPIVSINESFSFQDASLLYHAKCASWFSDTKLEPGESLSRKFRIRRCGLRCTFVETNSKLHGRRKSRSNTCRRNARLEDRSSKSHAMSFDPVLGELE